MLQRGKKSWLSKKLYTWLTILNTSLNVVLIWACKFPHRQLLRSAWERQSNAIIMGGVREHYSECVALGIQDSRHLLLCHCWRMDERTGSSMQAATPDLLWEAYSLPRGAMTLFQQTRGPGVLSLSQLYLFHGEVKITFAGWLLGRVA